MVESDYGERPEGARWLRGVVYYLDPQKLVQFHAALAEIGLRSGKLATTVNAARMARKYAREGSPEQAWTQVYEGAALVVGLAPEEGLALLNAAETAGVPEPIRELIAGARAISHLIRSPPPPVPEAPAEAAKSALAPIPVAVKSVATAPAEPHATAVRVKARLAQIDKMLKDIDE
jgi:hypothetical protein